MTNSSSANWIYDMLLFHIVLLLWIALVWTKTTTYWVSVNIIVLRYVEVSLRSINTYLRAFVQEPCVGSPSEEDFPPHYEVHLIKALVSQCTLTVQKLVYSYSDLQFVILLSLSLQADYIYLLRNHTNTIFFTTLNLDLNVDVFGTWYRSTLSQPFVWSLATTASASASMSAGAGGCRLWLWRAWTWTWRAFKSSWRAFWLSSILLTLRWSLRRMLWMLFRSASAVWTSDMTSQRRLLQRKKACESSASAFFSSSSESSSFTDDVTGASPFYPSFRPSAILKWTILRWNVACGRRNSTININIIHISSHDLPILGLVNKQRTVKCNKRKICACSARIRQRILLLFMFQLQRSDVMS